MHNNYYFLRHLSRQLQSRLTGFLVEQIYSQQKNELTILLHQKDKEVIINARLDNEFSCLYLPDKAIRARRNSVDLFKKIHKLEILDIVQVENDRSFYFQLQEDFKLVFKMYGNRANILLIKEKEVLEIFRNNLKQDKSLNIAAMPKTIDTSFQNFEALNGNYKLICPTFGKAFDHFFLKRNYDYLTLSDKYQIFKDLLNYLESPDYFLHIQPNEKPLLSLYKIQEDDQVFKDPIDALNKLYKSFIGDYLLQKEKEKIRRILYGQIQNCVAYIEKSKLKLANLSTANSYSHIADLIMANLHAIKPHTKEVTLTDFYTQKPVSIKLKSNISPQLNAQKYYKKSKKQQIEISNLEKTIEQKAQQLSELKDQIKALSQVTRLRQLKNEKVVKGLNIDLPYHETTFMNYEILVGKNAKKNEALTFGLAAKEDLFLHAKDSAGSHVIIRRKTNQNYPRLVIEKAASYAAFYSKSKNESLVRVLYTPKKYVRKAKGSPAGSVIITKEKVILVKPEPLKK